MLWKIHELKTKGLQKKLKIIGEVRIWVIL